MSYLLIGAIRRASCLMQELTWKQTVLKKSISIMSRDCHEVQA